MRQEARGQRDVEGSRGDAGGGGVGLHDGKPRLGRQPRGFVGQGVEDLRGLGHGVSGSLRSLRDGAGGDAWASLPRKLGAEAREPGTPLSPGTKMRARRGGRSEEGRVGKGWYK